jgi:phage tail-like protein
MPGPNTQPGLPANDPIVVNSFSLEVQGLEMALFSEVDGFESENDITELRQTDKSGRPSIIKTPGPTKWADITLKRGLVTDDSLFTWREQVIAGNMAAARRDGSISGYNAMGELVIQYTFQRGWPSKWKGSGFTAGGSDAATEELTISHEGLVRVK